MLFSIKDTIGYAVQSEDGEVGMIDDFLFDDVSSNIRYLVISTGSWLTDRQVLLAPAAFGEKFPSDRSIRTALTKQQVKDSPPIDSLQPVSRQEEERLHVHYGWSPYWEDSLSPLMGTPYWGAAPVLVDPDGDQDLRAEAGDDKAGDPHLRSASEVIGYYLGANDGDIGHVEDLLVGEDDWVIRYLVIDTRNWLPGKKVLVATEWLMEVDWRGQKISVDLDRDRIESSPVYDTSRMPDRAYQKELYQHYGRAPFKPRAA